MVERELAAPVEVVALAGAADGGVRLRRSLSTTVDNFVTGASSDLSMSGMAVGASGGVQVFVSPKLALDGGGSVGVGRMGNIKVDGQRQDWGTPDRTTTTRIRFGANWYP